MPDTENYYINVLVPPSFKTLVQDHAYGQGVSMSAWMRDAAVEKLQREGVETTAPIFKEYKYRKAAG